MRLNIKFISKNLKKVLRLLEGHLGAMVLMVFSIILLYAILLLWVYVFNPAFGAQIGIFEKVEIKKAIFDRVIEQIELREKNILEAMGKEYPDIFR